MTTESYTRTVVAARSNGVCELRLPGCYGQATSKHHRRNRSQGGGWSPSNVLNLCGNGVVGCHGWVTDHPDGAHAIGATLWAGEDPETTPVQMYYLGSQDRYLLGDDGSVRKAD